MKKKRKNIVDTLHREAEKFVKEVGKKFIEEAYGSGNTIHQGLKPFTKK